MVIRSFKPKRKHLHSLFGCTLLGTIVLTSAAHAHRSANSGMYGPITQPANHHMPMARLLAATDQPMRTLPEAPDDSVVFAQMTEGRPLDLSQSRGRIGFVWGGNAAGAVGSKYYPVDRDLDRTHTAAWYAANAPDQIVYKCDGSTPASLYNYEWGSYSPLDISNPAARKYILTRYIAPALDNGYRVIALDNVSLRNNGQRCGIYRGGQWVQLYSGKPVDSAFSDAMLDWVSWLAREIHARGGYLALNAKVDPINPDQTRKLIALADYWLEEAGNTIGCRARTSDKLWRTKFDLARWASDFMGWIDVEKTCASPSALDEDEAQWAVGNYLLARGPRSYLGLAKDGERAGIDVILPRGLGAPVGAAVGPAFEVPGGWARRFRRGLVIVNPSSTDPLSFDLPSGAWMGFNGEPAQSSIQVPPSAARILFGGSNDAG